MLSFFKHRPDVLPEGLCVCVCVREKERDRVGDDFKKKIQQKNQMNVID